SLGRRYECKPGASVWIRLLRIGSWKTKGFRERSRGRTEPSGSAPTTSGRALQPRVGGKAMCVLKLLEFGLLWTTQSEPDDHGVQRSRLQAEQFGGTVFAANSPMSSFEHTADMLAANIGMRHERFRRIGRVIGRQI